MLESKRCPQGGWEMGWSGAGSVRRKVFHSLMNISGEASIYCFREEVNFLPVPFLEGSVVRTLLDSLCPLFTFFRARRKKEDLPTLLGLFFLFCFVFQSLTHCARPGIEPTTSWLPVGFLSTVPRRELQDLATLLDLFYLEKNLRSSSRSLFPSTATECFKLSVSIFCLHTAYPSSCLTRSVQ